MAGVASLGVTTEPTNPSLFALVILVLAWAGAVCSFYGKRKYGNAFSWIVLIPTGLYALTAFTTIAPSIAKIEPLAVLFYLALRGGLGFVLATLASIQLRKRQDS